MNYLIILFYLFVAILTFGKLPFGFFQQDEWLIFGTYLYLDKAPLDWLQRFFIYKQVTHLVPFTHFISYAQFELFRLNFFFYGVVAIILHLTNAILVYYLSSLLLKKRFLSFISGFLFLTTSISHQGFTWIATTISTSNSTLFLLLSLIFFTKYLNQTISQIRYIILSTVFFAISLLFKENSIFTFLFLPAFWFIYKRKDFTKLKMGLIILFPLGFFYTTIRIVNFFIISLSNSMEAAFAQPGLDVYVYRIFTLPLRFISQGILPQEFIIKIANNLMKLSYPPNSMLLKELSPYIAQSVGADIVSFFFSVMVIIICIIFLFLYKGRVQQYSKTILVSLVFISLSSLPFIFVPGKAGYNSLVDGRHLYITEIFTSILLPSLSFGFYILLRKSRIALALLVITFVLVSYYHITNIRSELQDQVQIGFLRKGILEQIYSNYPHLPQSIIFYVESDKAYYGLPPEETVVPFQSGFGQTLLVWYNDHGELFPACFFQDQYLYVQESVGYRECDGRGFGYVRSLAALRRILKDYQLSSDNLIAFSWNSSKGELRDITIDTHEAIK